MAEPEQTSYIVEARVEERADGFYITSSVDRRPHQEIGPFKTRAAAEAAAEDAVQMVIASGAGKMLDGTRDN